jgi:hypothetical protein
MDIFRVHQELIDDVQEELAEGKQWPEPWLSLNPMFASRGSIDELVTEKLLHPRAIRVRLRPNGIRRVTADH